MKTLFIIVLIFGFSFNLSAQWFSLSSNTDNHIRSVHFTDKDESWSVPSGTRTIKATSSFYKDYEASHKFYSGQTTTIRLEISNKKRAK